MYLRRRVALCSWNTLARPKRAQLNDNLDILRRWILKFCASANLKSVCKIKGRQACEQQPLNYVRLFFYPTQVWTLPLALWCVAIVDWEQNTQPWSPLCLWLCFHLQDTIVQCSFTIWIWQFTRYDFSSVYNIQLYSMREENIKYIIEHRPFIARTNFCLLFFPPAGSTTTTLCNFPFSSFLNMIYVSTVSYILFSTFWIWTIEQLWAFSLFIFFYTRYRFYIYACVHTLLN